MLKSMTVRAGILAFMAALSVSAYAVADAPRQIDIPAGDLASALEIIARQAGVELMYSSARLKGIHTEGLHGEYTAETAVEKLLQGTKLRLTVHESGGLLISDTAAGSASSPFTPTGPANPQINESLADGTQASSQEAAPLAAGQRKSFWERLRLAQVDQGTTATNGSGEATRKPAASADEGKLEEIVVTAQKRTERLIDTPQSVSVLSAGSLAKLGATQFRDFANTVPGLNFQTGGAGFNQLSLRGVTTGYDITPSVGNVVDDVPYGSSSAFGRGAQLALDIGLFDIDRIEVLRGPQGTLYGASTMGGLIKYVTKQPDPSAFAAEVRTGISSTKDGDLNYIAAGGVNLPLVADKAALRASGFYSRDGGYIDNVALGREDVNRSNVYGGRLDLALTPTEALSVRLAAVAQNIARDGTATTDYTVDRVSIFGNLEQFRLIPETFDQRFRLVSATATYALEQATLTSVSSYQTVDSHFIIDDSPFLVPVLALCPPFCRSYSAVYIDNGVSTDKFTQEVRLASTGTRRIEWLVGGFYTKEVSVNNQEVLLLDAARQPAPNDLFHYHTPSSYKEYAAFGNVTFRLTDKFDVTGGLRAARNEQAFTQDASGILIGGVPKRTDTANVYTYLANARYHFSQDATGYIRYATGYRPGGPNAASLDPLTGLPNAPQTFKSDTSKSYEVGFKAQNGAGTFGFDIAAYHIDWKDLQQLTTTPSGVSYFANSTAGATIDGAELAINARPFPGFVATAAFAFQDATMSKDEPALGADKGERLPNVPRFTAALGADYTFPSSAVLPTVGATFRSVSDRDSSFDNNTTVAQYNLGSYSILDLRAGLTLRAVEFQVYVHNLLDEHGQMTIPSGVSSAAGPIEVSVLQPLTIGINATARF